MGFSVPRGNKKRGHRPPTAQKQKKKGTKKGELKPVKVNETNLGKNTGGTAGSH